MVRSGFFNAVNGAPTYSADDFNNFMDGFLTDGVYEHVDHALEVRAGTGMQVQVLTGRARIKGHFVVVDATETLNIRSADVSEGRWDSVILRYNRLDRTVTLVVSTGTAGAAMGTATYYRTDDVWDLILAYVYVAPNATSVVPVDRRAESLCGYCRIRVSGFNAVIREYKGYKMLEWATSILVPDIIPELAQYAADTDILYVNVNGFLLVENVDYTVDHSGENTVITLTNELAAGNVAEVRILKSVVTTV